MREGKPSRTAIKVTSSIITLGTTPYGQQILPDGLVEASEKMLVASGVVGEKAARWIKSPRMVSVYKSFDWLLPGQFEALGERKAFFERQVRAGIAAGATQVLVLGAGFDTLGWRLATEFPEVNFFEIDHPMTANFKAEAVSRIGKRDNLYLMAEDLGNRKLTDAMESHGFWNSESRSVILAEGLLMYLRSEDVTELFGQCLAIAGADSRVVFSYIPSGPDGQLDAGRWTSLMLWLQKVAGEPWLWSIGPEDIGPFLDEIGWKISPELEGGTGRHSVEYFAVATNTV
jgi:methyltransferase (TIGR00027 family)